MLVAIPTDLLTTVADVVVVFATVGAGVVVTLFATTAAGLTTGSTTTVFAFDAVCVVTAAMINSVEYF
jgi:hypothetical protein